jgi:transcriptional regulator with XRE-family HTH domain
MEVRMKTIRQLRDGKGWTQVELAHRIGVTPSTIYNWERGRFTPRVEQLRALAGVFGVRMDDVALTIAGTGDAKKLLAAAA